MNETENEKTTVATKKPYLKPKLRRVELRPQEAVLGSCKSMGGTVGGGAGGTCSNIACQSQGS
ncbi:MAG TPA: hypothetical protein VF708_08600 [Pyrinomonadaceae bacterium]|jgi:hypothetical protein